MSTHYLNLSEFVAFPHKRLHLLIDRFTCKAMRLHGILDGYCLSADGFAHNKIFSQYLGTHGNQLNSELKTLNSELLLI